MTALRTVLLLAAALASGPAAADHPSWSLESCRACHPADEAPALEGRLARPCRTLCSSCHDFRDRHHTVGAPIPRAAPLVPLLLTASGATTCVTCHDTSLPRSGRIPWASQSLFERVVRRSREHRTFYLAVRNDRGQLCRACH